MFELVLRAPGDAAETLSDRLIDELGALSVAVEDGDAGTPAEHALFGEPGLPVVPAVWPHSTLRALFADEDAATAATMLLVACAAPAALQVASMQALPDEDWVRLTQSQFPPVEVAPGFWIVPTWHERPPGARRAIRLDPGLAFGTGSHATTRMCLRWIARESARDGGSWDRVLDYGCGSGILAIAAALHGAGAVDAVDIDPAAVAATAANASANGVSVNAGLPEAATGGYSLVLANILATPLKLLAPLLAAHVAPKGRLVLSGILERQAADIALAYAGWLPLNVGDREDGWVLMEGLRPPGRPAPPATAAGSAESRRGIIDP
jgi:ribosomal protein L11 methyltransferase